MSFTSDVKDELARIELADDNKKAQLSAAVQILSTLSLSSAGLRLEIRVANANVIRRISRDLKSLYGVSSDITVTRQANLKKRNIYTLVIREKVREILGDLDLWTDRGLLNHPRMSFLKDSDMIQSYVAGCFMAAGSVNSPKSTSYHLEIRVAESSLADFIVRVLEKTYISARTTARRSEYVVYIKSSETIADFLKAIGANEAVMTFEDVRIQRDFLNSMTRLDNVSIANEQKSLKMADEQMEAVSYLNERGLLKYLSEKDRQMAMLRYQNPQASLSELSELYYAESGTSLSKSGIRHRFEKIMAMADKYREREAVNEH